MGPPQSNKRRRKGRRAGLEEMVSVEVFTGIRLGIFLHAHGAAPRTTKSTAAAA